MGSNKNQRKEWDFRTGYKEGFKSHLFKGVNTIREKTHTEAYKRGYRQGRIDRAAGESCQY